MAKLFLLLAPLLSLTVQAREIDHSAVLVNSDVILHSQIAEFRKSFTARKEIDLFIRLFNFSEANANNDKEVLDYLVQEQLILQKHPASDDEVEAEINTVQTRNRIDREHFKEVLKAQGVKFEDYRHFVQVNISKSKLRGKELDPLAAVSDEDVKNFYYTDANFQKRRKESKLVLTYTLQQMLLPNSALTEAAQKRIRAGEDFDAVASDLSTKGVESSRLGSISEDNMNAQIRKAIEGLKVGESTRAIAAGSGYMILRILEIGAPKDPEFEREKEAIRARLFEAALKNQLRLWTDREKAASYIHVSN